MNSSLAATGNRVNFRRAATLNLVAASAVMMLLWWALEMLFVTIPNVLSDVVRGD
jgi:uncharacterized membrane-anchored protein